MSVVTTTGFATADSNQWTSFAVILLIFGSIVCACAGSTAGGIKTNRLVLAMKMMRTRLRQQQHPNAIIRIRLDGVIQETEALHSVMIFIVAYLMLILAGTVFGTIFGVDLMTKMCIRDSYLAFGTAAPEVPGPVLPDSVGVKWYNDEYVALYGRLTSAIKNYMTSTQSSLAPRAEQMKKNAYRAVTPVLISLAVMIAIVLMLYYFMSVYCVNPILRMNKGLGDYLSFRVPFVVKADCKDEMLELKEKIETLITISKQPKA